MICRPHRKQIDTYAGMQDQPSHGYSGPIRVSTGTDLGIGKQFLDVGKVYDASRPQVDDNNDLVVANAYSVSL